MFLNWKLIKNTELNIGEFNIDARDIKVSCNKGEYFLYHFLSDGVEVMEETVYKLDYKIVSDGCKCKFLAEYYSKGVSVLKEYINKDEMITPKSCDTVVFEIMIFGDKKGRCEFSFNGIFPVKKYKPKKIRMAAVHIDSYQDQERTCEDNLNDGLKGIDRAAKENPDIIVLTENFYSRRAFGKENKEVALTLDSEPINILRAKAKEHNTYLAFSFLKKKEKGFSNTGLLIGRTGEIEGMYDKAHITYGERKSGFVPGNELPVFDTDFGKVAFAICWDLWFPEAIYEYYKKGAEIIINPTAGFPDIQMRARAIDCGMYIISSGIMDRTKTRIVSPLGEVVSDASVNGYAFYEADLKEKNKIWWLSCGNTYSDGRNIYINERREEILKGE